MTINAAQMAQSGHYNQWLNTLSVEELAALKYDWPFWRREKQTPPAGDWRYWLLMGGRGFGKTRTGAEMVREWVRDYEYVNLIGATSDDARDIMIEGESGILAICPPDERPEYRKHLRRLDWPNGAKSLIFTADQPDRLRGKQHMKLWPDELAAWRYPEAWDQAMFGLRLGDNPQAVITTTPKPTAIIKELVANPNTVVIAGTTYENRANLANAFFDSIIGKYEGTRLGNQELLAMILDDIEGALWSRDMIERSRVSSYTTEMKRIVVAVDPAVTSGPDSDDTGIVVVGLGWDDHGYVLEDRTLSDSPARWGAAAVNAYHDWQADLIVAEANNGGDLVETVLRTLDRNVSYKKEHAARGKIPRAEPVASLYEQGKVHHVGGFSMLEDEMCTYVPGDKSPDRMDALVWGISNLMLGGAYDPPTVTQHRR